MRTIALLIALAALGGASAPAPNYHLTHRFVLGGEGGWDYLTYDPAAKRLFVSRSTHVMVVDPMTGTVVGDIPDTPGVHGIALAPDLGKGFTSNGADGSVTVFDLRSRKHIATIRTAAKNPDAIVYEPAGKRVFTFNGGSNDATVIDAQRNAVVATIPLGGRPEFAVTDGKGMIYDNIESTSEIVTIDARKAQIVARWPLGTCQGLRAFQWIASIVACSPHARERWKSSTRTAATSSPPCRRVPTDATRFDPQTKLAFASNGRDGTLTVVREDSPTAFKVVQNAKTEAGARTMALDLQRTSNWERLPGLRPAPPQRLNSDCTDAAALKPATPPAPASRRIPARSSCRSADWYSAA